MQTVECRVTTERLLAYLQDPDHHRVEADAALDHIGECPYCKNRLGYLVRALTQEKKDPLTCQECQELLPDYLQAETDGQAGEAGWRPVALHLETCPHCAAEYAKLLELIELAFGEQGTEPPRYPVPKLPFLQAEEAGSPQPVGKPWRLDELGRLVIEFSTELLRALQPPAHQPAPAMLKSPKSSRTLCQLSLKEAVKDREVTITAEERRDDPNFCTVIVQVNIPSRGEWPHLAGTEVALKRDELELGTQRTDAFGEAVFEGIASADLAYLVFEITPQT